MLLISMTAKSEIWYYIDSGHSPEESNIQVTIVIKDNSGQLWSYSEPISTLKQNLLNNRDYYIDAFNKGTHKIDDGYYSSVFGKQLLQPTYDENKILSPMLRSYGFFARLIVLEKTEKSYVVEDSFSHGKIAFSFDFKTMVGGCDKVNPIYCTSVPVDRFIVRRSIDDLF